MTIVWPMPGLNLIEEQGIYASTYANFVRRGMTDTFSLRISKTRKTGTFRAALLGCVTAGLVLASLMPAVADDTAGLSRTRDDLNQKDRKRVERVVQPATSFEAPEKFELMQGGAGTSTKLLNRDALSHFNANLTFEQEETFKLGNALFRKLWVTSPSSTQASDGLGPLFNARACQSCHIKDGRGHPPEGAADATSMFLRLARPAKTGVERQALEDFLVASLPDPVYGGQLQDLAVPGLKAEGSMVIEYEEQPFELGDGTVISLRKPSYSVADLAFGPLDPDTTLSPRMSPPMTGMGLIEAIHPADILAHADPEDQDGDGVSGRVAMARDPATGKLAIGRFGWKAQNATVRQQSSGAFAGDIGISTPDVPTSHGDCTARQAECLALPTGVQASLGETEAPDPVLGLVTFYSQNLAAPARRLVGDAGVLAGKEAFYNLGCVACHVPKYVTSRRAVTPAHRFQLIWPYSDFLLHDMGEGLADGQQVGAASGQEWRTPPLWGTGLTEIVNDHTFFLHDGRARNLTEAILWHGGEAENARDGFAGLDRTDRNNLLKFLESL